MGKWRRLLIVLGLVLALGAASYATATYLHPFNRYRRAAMGWLEEFDSIATASEQLIEEYHGRESAAGFAEAYREQVLDRWVALQSEVEQYDAPPQVAESHALLLLAIQEHAAAATALLEEPGSGGYAAHLEKALQAMNEHPRVFRRERRDWIGQ